MSSNLQPAPEARQRPRCSPALRVRISKTERGEVIEPVLDRAANLKDFHAAFLSAFGTTERVIAEALFEQILNVVHTDPAKPLDAATANLVLALLHRIGPRDELEAMLACQMITSHTAAMDVSRRALHVEQTTAGRAAYLGLARKLMTLFTAQMDALNRHRGKRTTQKIVIERVFLAPGAQAIVGAVASGGYAPS
jgi:hypothetical protein